MELHAEYRVLNVGKAHDLALLGPGRDLQAIGKLAPQHQKRMITRRIEGTR